MSFISFRKNNIILNFTIFEKFFFRIFIIKKNIKNNNKKKYKII